VRQPLLKDSLDFSKITENEAWESAKRSFTRKIEEITLDVVRSYYELIRLEEDLLTNLKSFERNKFIYQKTLAEFEIGKVREIDVIKQRNQQKRAEDSIKDVENSLLEKRRTFNDLVGFPKDQATSLSSTLAYSPIDINVEELIEIAMQERLDLIDAKESYKRSQESYYRSKSNMWPELDWFLTYSVGNSDTDFSRTFNESGRPSWKTGIEMSYSLDRLPLRIALFKAEESLRKSERSIRDFEESIVEGIEDFKREVEQNERDVQFSRQELDIREKQFMLDLDAYEIGTIDAIELNRREDELNNQRRNYFKNLERQQILIFRLEKIKGVLGKDKWIKRYLSNE